MGNRELRAKKGGSRKFKINETFGSKEVDGGEILVDSEKWHPILVQLAKKPPNSIMVYRVNSFDHVKDILTNTLASIDSKTKQNNQT